MHQGCGLWRRLVLEDTGGEIVRRAQEELLCKTGGVYVSPFPAGMEPRDVLN